MFRRRVTVERLGVDGAAEPCPVKWIDNFAMRNFTNDAIFDDTLPVEEGLLEIGNRVPIEQLAAAMGDWFQRKGYLAAGECVRLTEL